MSHTRYIVERDIELLRAYQGLHLDPRRLHVNTFTAAVDMITACERRGLDPLEAALHAMMDMSKTIQKLIDADITRIMRTVEQPRMGDI
jgi:hypothetical protein